MNLKELEEKLKREYYLVTPTSYGSVISYVKENKNDPNWDKRPFTYGISHNEDGYSFFFTNERGGTLSEVKYKTENEACNNLYKRLENDRKKYKVKLLRKIKQYLTANYHLSNKRVEEVAEKLLKHYPIADEFYRTVNFGFPLYNPVKVKGYTAQSLYNNYDLSILGAYNYLIYLQEHPKDAIKDLEMGLPRR